MKHNGENKLCLGLAVMPGAEIRLEGSAESSKSLAHNYWHMQLPAKSGTKARHLHT